MILKTVLENINFSNRYRNICDKNNDFNNRLRGNKKDFYLKVLNEFDYCFKYISNGSFFKIISKVNLYEFQLNLVLKDGQIECLLFVKYKNIHIEPCGRIDFLPMDLGIPFERKELNLPLYSDETQLKNILKDIFYLFEDIKRESLLLNE